MSFFLGLSGLAGSARLFASVYVTAAPRNEEVRYDL